MIKTQSNRNLRKYRMNWYNKSESGPIRPKRTKNKKHFY